MEYGILNVECGMDSTPKAQNSPKANFGLHIRYSIFYILHSTLYNHHKLSPYAVGVGGKMSTGFSDCSPYKFFINFC
ncbi:MAG: hypothetical protein UY07_C0015G0008 [Parcubacteria group bacterium GW2011_GWA1_47_8]|nr:MAG: hypothetical protein UY07_C0015G0008 [Parcubacteria group bacterium GW2011_GWA1_47_8]